MGKTKGMLKQLLSVFLESRCAFCQRSAGKIFCQYCQAKLMDCALAPEKRLVGDSSLPVFAWGKYDRELKRAIALMKYNNNPEIGNILGTLLGKAWLEKEFYPSKATVVPIPMHREKLQERGFNQAEIIAQGFCRLTGYQLNDRALIRIRKTEAMFNLKSSAARVKNLQGALKLDEKLPKYPVLVIDDIYTTGTTVNESIRVLQQKKIEVIGIAVVAKAGYG